MRLPAIEGIILRRILVNFREVYSSYFGDEANFPKGTAEFDHALIMRNIAHEWHTASDLHV